MLSNFNHERWVMICSAARGQRMIVEECLKYVAIFILVGYGLNLCLIGGRLKERPSASLCTHKLSSVASSRL